MRTAFCVVALLLASVPARLAVAPQERALDWQASDGPYVGAVLDISPSPRSGRLFAATSSGLQRSVDDGVSWSACGEVDGPFARFLADGRLLVGPSKTGMLAYLDEECRVLGTAMLPADFNSPRSFHALGISSTGRVLASRWGSGLLLSDDHGLTWRPAALPSPKSPWIMSIVALRSGRLVASTQASIFRSSDNGETWAIVSQGGGRETLTLDSSGALLAAGGDGIWRSTDEGDTWQRVGLEKQLAWTVLSSKAADARAGDEWFAAVSPAPDVDNVVFRSSDRGLRWATTSSELKGRVHTLVATRSGALLAGSSRGFFRSTNQGGSWAFRGVARAPLRVIVPGPAGLVFAGDPEAWRSSDGGRTWEPMLVYLNEGYARSGLGDTPKSLATIGKGHLLAGVANGVAVSADEGKTWQRSGLWRHTSSLLELPDGSIMAGALGGMFRSTDGGMKWIEQSVGLSEFDVRGVALLESGELVAGTLHEVYMSSDNGANWRLTKTGLPRLPKAPVIPSGRGQVAVIGTDRGVYRFDAASGAWILAAATESPVLSLAWDSGQRLWAGTDSHGVRALRPRAGAWLDSPAGLSGFAVFALAIDSGTIVAGTSRGTFHAALR